MTFYAASISKYVSFTFSKAIVFSSFFISDNQHLINSRISDRQQQPKDSEQFGRSSNRNSLILMVSFKPQMCVNGNKRKVEQDIDT
jgi:hypothetical protein